jgi:hypothetical protein
MRARHYSLTLLAFIFLAPLHAFAGAWLQDTDSGMVMVQATHYSADQFFDDKKNRKDLPKFEKSELNIYAEYGLNAQFTVGMNMFANFVKQDALTSTIPERENIGLADTELFLRTPLYQDDAWMVSLQPLIKLPSLYDKNINLRGGSRSTDMEMSLLVGRNQPIISDKDFIDTRIGYRERNRDLAAQWRLDATLGLYPAQDWLVTLSARSVISDKSDTATPFRQDGEQDYDLHKLEIGARYQLTEDYWLQTTLFKDIAGEFSGAGEGISLGIGLAF